MFLPSVMSLGKVKMKPFICIWLNPAIVLIYHLNQVNWLNWLTWTIHPSLCDYCAETHGGRVPSWRPMSQLLSFASPLRRLQHWAADAAAHRQHCQTLCFLHSGSFLPSHPLFFLQSQSPFSISIRRHSSAKCISAFSGYASITVSALLNTDPTAAAAAWRWKPSDTTTLPSTWRFYMTPPLNVGLTNKR